MDGAVPEGKRISIINNAGATFANFRLSSLTPRNVLLGKYQPTRELATHAHTLPRLAEVTLPDHDPPAATASPTVKAYRRAPQKLSEWSLFVGNGATQQPAEGVMPYALNTVLFSDYTHKDRFLRIPPGTSAEYRDRGVLKFPEGTVIAKTFAYPHDESKPELGQRLLETRIEVLEGGEWFGYSYQWNDEQTEATLLLGGTEFDVSWIRADGTQATNRYEIP